MIPVQATYLRPRSGFILLALVPLAILFYVGIVTSRGDWGMWVIAILIGIIPLGIFLFQRNSFVMIDNDGIIYKTPVREKTISWRDVSKSYLKMRYTGKSSQRLWHFENSAGKGLAFPTGSYNRRSLQTIAEAITAKCPQADIAPKIREMAEGKFPWYVW
jgi:hypothetical protein